MIQVLSRHFQLALLLMAAQGVPFKTTRKSYTREFKLKVVKLYRDPCNTLYATSKHFSVSNKSQEEQQGQQLSLLYKRSGSINNCQANFACVHVANNCGRGLKQLAFRHLPLFKHPFCRYCPDKHRCLKTGAYGMLEKWRTDLCCAC